MFPYILKATFCLVLLLGFYHLTLEKEKMHRFNRFYLLGSILFSCLVPSFIITVAPAVLETPVFAGIGILEQISFEATSQQSIDYTDYIIGLYTLVSTILFILLSKKVYDLLNKAKRNQQVNYFSATVVLLKERIVPYTFLHYIFINKFTYQTDSLEEQILTHELAHVQQKHSIDVLFIQVLQNLFWFNPIFRYYKKAIQLNHEFLADDAVINSHKNITEYQQVLLNTTAQNNNIYLASNLNYSLTKKRLLMMTTPSFKTNILLKKLLVLPLVAGFIFAFAQRVEAQENKDTIEPFNEQPEKIKIVKDLPIEIIEKQVFTPKGEEVKTGFKDLNGIKHFFVTIDNNTKYYNREGKLVNNKGEIVSKRKANASNIVPGNYVTKIYFDGNVFCEFIDNKPNERIQNSKEFKNISIIEYIKKHKDNNIIYYYNNKSIKHIKALDLIENNRPIDVITLDIDGKKVIKLSKKKNHQEKGISKKGMNQYKLLFGKEKSTQIYKHKDVRKMIALYKAMSKKQQRSVTDIRKVLPPAPPPPKPRIREVKKARPVSIKVIEVQKENRVEVIELKEVEVMPEVVEIIETPLTEEVVEVMELQEVEAMPEVIEIIETPIAEEVVEVMELTEVEVMPEVIEIIENSTTTNQLVEVVELQKTTNRNPPPPPLKKNATHKEKQRYLKAQKDWKKTRQTTIKAERVLPSYKTNVGLVKLMKKKGAKFLYNEKNISYRKALRLVSKNKKLSIYRVMEKGKPIILHISDKK